jgi:ubiquitin-conjugating enzyme E2 variant
MSQDRSKVLADSNGSHRPRVAVAPRPPGDPFEVEPYNAREIRFHATGGMLAGLWTLAGLAWLGLTWSAHRPAGLGLALAVLAGLYAADLASGLLHWAFDTWFDADLKFIRRMVLQVREHHIYPHRIFLIGFTQDAGTLSWIAIIVTAPLWLWAALAPRSLPAFYGVVAGLVFLPLLIFMLEFHKCGHRPRNPAWVRWLQRAGLVLSVPHHVQHHGGNHDFNYCLINGWADRTLGRWGLFRALEWSIERWTGAQPQRDDHEWLRRYGRSVAERRQRADDAQAAR